MAPQTLSHVWLLAPLPAGPTGLYLLLPIPDVCAELYSPFKGWRLSGRESSEEGAFSAQSSSS